jgi:diaminopimelate epimerase
MAVKHIPFVKYHGAGNDFIMIDDRQEVWDTQIHEAWIAHACHRRYGIGADGFILLQPGKDGADFYMKYYNSDGRISTFCGNGGRCAVAFAARIGIHNGRCKFLGTDGWHAGEIHPDGQVSISMTDVKKIETIDEKAVILNTGSPHYVTFVDQIIEFDVVQKGRTIRYSPRFKEEGINVNFVEQRTPGEILIRTYERGVEDETYACGTGVVAAAIASAFSSDGNHDSWVVHAKGGDLCVDFQRQGEQDFVEIKLKGPAVEVFNGNILIKQ